MKWTLETVESSRQLEVHSYSWLSHLQLGQATQVLQEKEKVISHIVVSGFSYLSFLGFKGVISGFQAILE